VRGIKENRKIYVHYTTQDTPLLTRVAAVANNLHDKEAGIDVAGIYILQTESNIVPAGSGPKQQARELGGVTVYPFKPTDEFIADNLVGCTLAEVERALVLNTLVYVDGNRTQAAMALGISVRCLRDKIRRLRTLGVAVPAPTPDQRNQAAAIG
jgi:DNA-binding NtrC family response regulator